MAWRQVDETGGHQETLGSNLLTDRETFQYFNNQYGHRQNVSLSKEQRLDGPLTLFLTPASA